MDTLTMSSTKQEQAFLAKLCKLDSRDKYEIEKLVDYWLDLYREVKVSG